MTDLMIAQAKNIKFYFNGTQEYKLVDNAYLREDITLYRHRLIVVGDRKFKVILNSGSYHEFEI